MSDTSSTLTPIVPSTPKPGDRTPRTRRRMMFFDRIKVSLLIGVVFGFGISKYHAEIPTISWGEATRDQLAAKRWLLALLVIELVRQLHYLASERSAGWHRFWSHRVFGGWDRFWSRRNPWFRFRMARLTKTAIGFVIATLLLSFLWGLSPFDAVVEAPLRIWNVLFGRAQGMPFIIEIAFTLIFAMGQFAAIFWFMSRGGVETYMHDEVDTRFADVWGQDRVLEKVKENIVFLDKPEEIEQRGGHVPSGILLWGPPGTGKTLIAKAVAGETGRPYVFVDPGAFQNMFFGVGILKVKALFRKLRKLSLRHGGVIVFFDEADSLGNRGLQVAGGGKVASAASLDYGCNGLHYLDPDIASQVVTGLRTQSAAASAPAASAERGGIARIVATGLGGGAGMGTLQALLTEMSGMEKPRGFLSRRLRSFLTMPAKKPPKYRILIMMATNAPDVLDEALLRPGRIDRQYKVDYPSFEGRKRTFEGYLDKVRHTIAPEQIERLALMSPYASGASIKDIVNEALIVAMRAGRDHVSWPDLLQAKSFKTHGMPDDVHPVSLERHATAIHEAGHAVATYRLKKKFMIDVATIEPRGTTGGFVSWVPREEPTKFPWRKSQEHDVMVALASLAAERHFYDGDNSVGVGGDLNASTQLVRSMEARAAMGSSFTSLIEYQAGDVTKSDYDRRVEERLRDLYGRAADLIADNETYVMAIAHALERYKSINGEDIEAIFEGRQGPIVDGTWYQTPEFRFLYSRFHAEALRAHEEQGKLEMNLPMPGSLVVVDPTGALRAWDEATDSDVVQPAEGTAAPTPMGELTQQSQPPSSPED